VRCLQWKTWRIIESGENIVLIPKGNQIAEIDLENCTLNFLKKEFLSLLIIQFFGAVSYTVQIIQTKWIYL
jgi:hypothetical protein